MKTIPLLSLSILFFVLNISIVNTQTTRTVMVIPIEGAIGPVTTEFLATSLKHAVQTQAEFVILQINTPGGLLTSTRDIVELILNSPIPVVGYVAPQGARAASAGMFILYATHLAAMAPGTHLGAAIPVSLGSGMFDTQDTQEETKPQPETEPQSKTQPTIPEDPMSIKVLQDTMAFIRSLAELRQRNSEFTQQAVQEGLSLTAQEAYEQNVIEIIALNQNLFLQQINGRTIKFQQQNYTFHTQNLNLLTQNPDIRTQLLMILTDPTISFLFLLIGLYALVFELYNPGTFVPGVFGLVCLLLSFYGLSILPLNFAALLLIIIGIGFIIAEAFVFSSGLFALGGTVAFFVGSLLLYDSADVSIQLEWSMILITAIVLTLLFVTLLMYTLRTQRQRIFTGNESIYDTIGTVISWKGKRGLITATGENWHAKANTTLYPGQAVKITNIKGLTLFIEPVDNNTPPSQPPTPE